MKIPKPLIVSLILFAACASITPAKTIEIKLMTEEKPTGKIYLTLSRDYAGNRNALLLEQELTPGINRIEMDDQILESNTFFGMSANGFKNEQGSLKELLERMESKLPLMMLFREREILVAYVISEDGRTFDEADTLRGEVWISDNEKWLPENPIPIVEEDFRFELTGKMVMINYHRTQKGYGIFAGDINQSYEEITEAPEGPYAYDNSRAPFFATLTKGTPRIFKICGYPQRNETYAKLVLKDIRKKPIPENPVDRQTALNPAAWKEVKFMKTPTGEVVGMLNPPADRAGIYLSEFGFQFPDSAKFDSYGVDSFGNSYDAITCWLSISSEDLPQFVKSNGMPPEAVHITSETSYKKPQVKNIRFPNENWRVDYIIRPGSTGVQIRILLMFLGDPARDIRNTDFLNDVKQHANDSNIVVMGK